MLKKAIELFPFSTLKSSASLLDHRNLKLWSNTDACIDTLIVLSFRYNGHYFVTTLIYSVLLGFLGMDRFCLGHTGTAVGKLLTLGGVGIWWIVDIVLLVNGMLTPDDGSNWVPYYWSRDLKNYFCNTCPFSFFNMLKVCFNFFDIFLLK